MAYINSIGTSNPGKRKAQSHIAEFMARAHQVEDDEKNRFLALYRATGIKYRYSVIDDYSSNIDYNFFPNNETMEPFPTTGKRMELYREEALKLSIASITDCLNQTSINPGDITDLITVSCTGMYAPGLDIDLVNELKIDTHVQRTAINYMGCYAAFNALKAADATCHKNTKAKVLIVCTELCSIHFQKLKLEDNILANALFGDGSAAVLVSNDTYGKINLELKAFHCDILKEGEQEMAWSIDDYGFQMKLSTYVPEVIKNGIGDLTRQLLDKLNLSKESISFYALHPGGKRILKAIESELSISVSQNRHAHNILSKFGNMSSPTVLFVIRELLKEITEEDDQKLMLSFAFGPGLTLESMLLKVKARQ